MSRTVIKMFGECVRRDLRSIWLRTPCR